MNYLSVCSGIEAATVGWHSLGWQAVAFSEIEPFPCAALAHHYPNVPNWGDMTKFKEWPDAAVDVLVGGTPCQSFSVAGLRKGLADPRGNLMLTYLAIAAKYRPEWLVWENVPGVLSSNGGNDFASLLRGLGELGYGFAYRILDAQYFGVPQRRRRVFVVANSRSWQRAAAVLFERHSLQGHPAPRREAGKRVAGTIKGGSGSRGYPDPSDGNGGMLTVAETLRCTDGGIDIDHAAAGHIVAGPITAGMSKGMRGTEGVESNWMVTVAGTLQASGKAAGSATQQDAESGLLVTHSLRGEGFDASEDGTGRGTPLVPVAYSMITANTGANGLGVAAEVAPTLDRAQPCAIAFVHQAGGTQTTLGYDQERGTAPTLSKCQTVAVALNIYGGNKRADRPEGGFYVKEEETSKTLDSATGLNPTCSQGGTAVMSAMQVRRLTPQECQTAAVAFTQDSPSVVAPTLTAANDPSRSPQSSEVTQQVYSVYQSSMAVRRLTPVECERLQGFPDDYTQVPYRNKPAADGPRYKALGNSMAVPVMAWIGKRIQQVEDISCTTKQKYHSQSCRQPDTSGSGSAGRIA